VVHMALSEGLVLGEVAAHTACAQQVALQTVAGNVAALQALGPKALQTKHFRREGTAGSHPGGRRFESG
jgi:hypothetical protein